MIPHPITLRILEFYSGIGGMRFAFEDCAYCHNGVIVEAFDVNDVANATYEHNFHHKPNSTSIEHLQASQIEKLDCNVWLMSPPCQPFTRTGLQKDTEDNRTKSFIHLIKDVLPNLKNKPLYILVENVKNFEISKTRDIFVEQLTKLEFEVQEFLLCPTQIGIPNARKRYYALAKRKPLRFHQPQLSHHLNIEFPAPSPSSLAQVIDGISNNSNNAIAPPQPSSPQPRTLEEFLERQFDHDESLRVPISGVLLRHHSYKFDIVTPRATRSCCFTKGYGKNFMGSGAFVQTKNCDTCLDAPSSSFMNFDGCTEEQVRELGIRYFAPREISNLLGFPPKERFEFPDSVKTMSRYQLLGNSLSVFVVRQLMNYLFAEHHTQGDQLVAIDAITYAAH